MNLLVRNLLALGGGCSIFLMVMTAQAAVSIGINFCDSGSQLASASDPGIVSGSNWNNIVGTNGLNFSVSNAALNDSTGNSTAARLSITGGNGLYKMRAQKVSCARLFLKYYVSFCHAT